MKKAVLLVPAVAVLALGAATYASNPSLSEGVKNIRREYHANAKFNFERYKDLRAGMSVAEVSNLLGREGSVMSAVTDEGSYSESRWWFNEPDNLMVTFIDGGAVGFVAMQSEKLVGQGWDL